MNFEFTEEQQLLKESVQRWAQDNYSFDQRRVASDNDAGFSQDVWSTFAELGWLSVPFSEEHGGYGGSIIDTAAIMQEMGSALVLEPFFATTVLFGGLLQQGINEQLKTDVIPQIIAGDLFGAAALYEQQSRFDISNIATTAKANGDAYSLSGTKTMVLGGSYANKLVVLARTSGGQTDERGLSLFLCDANTDGVEINGYTMMDGHHSSDIHFDNANAQLISELDNAHSSLMSVMQTAHVALCSEAMGIMEKLNKSTVEYTKTRHQFGVPISSFQALQHRMVDTFMAFEQCRSLWVGALCELTDDSTSDLQADKIVNALRVLVARNGKLIGDEAIQLHGGMGITDELDIGHYVKRLMMINLMFGNSDFFQHQFNQVSYQQTA